MNMLCRIVAVSFASLVLAGCATVSKPPIETSQDLTNQRSMTFVFPQQLAQQVQASDLVRNLQTDSYRRSLDQYHVDVLRWNRSKTSCSVERYRAFQFSSGREGQRQLFAYECVIDELAGAKLDLNPKLEIPESTLP
jgi:outer membrane biogenesis lipoprotein LolB